MTPSNLCTYPALEVAVVTETYPPEVNGVAMTLGRMVAGLLARGHRVHLTRPRQNSDDTARNDEAYRETLVQGIPIPGYRGLRVGVPARILLRKQWQLKRPDVVQVATEGPLGAAAIAAARALNIPVVSEFHTNFHTYSKHYGVGWLEGLVAAHLRRLHNRSALTLVPTLALADELATQGYRNLRVVSRGIDNALFHPGRRSAELRRQWSVTDDQLVVSYVGRIAAEKNLPLVLRSFDAIRQNLPSARLLLVGDGPLRKRLAQQHPEHIFAGMRHGEDLATHYASSDLFLFPSLTETFGNVTTEALASGLPVVAYRTAAAAELVSTGHNGTLLEPGDEAAFIAGAVELARLPATRAMASANAVASVAARGWEPVHDSLVATLREVIVLSSLTLPPPATPQLATQLRM